MDNPIVIFDRVPLHPNASVAFRDYRGAYSANHLTLVAKATPKSPPFAAPQTLT